MDVSYSSNRYLEFNRKGVNKGNGLLRLAGLLGVKREETMAIGDHINDLSMIRAAGLGIGMQNAVEAVTEAILQKLQITLGGSGKPLRSLSLGEFCSFRQCKIG